jgi:hypothetical protein
MTGIVVFDVLVIAWDFGVALAEWHAGNIGLAVFNAILGVMVAFALWHMIDSQS